MVKEAHASILDGYVNDGDHAKTKFRQKIT